MAKHVGATCCWQQAELGPKCCQEMGVFQGMGKMGWHSGTNRTLFGTNDILKVSKLELIFCKLMKRIIIYWVIYI